MQFDNSDDLFDLRLLSYLLSKTEILYKIDSNKSKNSVETNIIIKDDVFKVLNITFNTNKNSKGLTDDFKNPSFTSGSSSFLPTLSGRNN